MMLIKSTIILIKFRAEYKISSDGGGTAPVLISCTQFTAFNNPLRVRNMNVNAVYYMNINKW